MRVKTQNDFLFNIMASNNQSSIGTFDFFEQLERIQLPEKGSDEDQFLTADEDVSSGDADIVAGEYSFTGEMTKPSPLPKKLSNGGIKDILAGVLEPSLGIMFPIEAVPRDPQDPDYKKGGLKEDVKFTTQKLTFRDFKKDGFSFVEYKNALEAKYDSSQKIEFLEAFTEANQFIGSMGTLQGLLNRLTTGLLKVPSVRKFDIDEQIVLGQTVLHYNQVDVDYVGKSLHEVMRDPRARSKFNGKSSLGVPYGSKKYKNVKGEIDREVIGQVYQNAAHILKHIANGKFSKMYVKQPAMFLVLLKNKQDYYRADELEIKTRPYFVYPAHERLLYQAIQTPLKPILFNDSAASNFTNSSAVGFIWNYGGGDELYDWINGHDDSLLSAEFRSIFYGDDQLWVIRLISGEKFVLCPDFSHMDLSLVKQWAKVAYGMWKPLYTSIDKTWSDVLLLNCRRCFSKTVLVESSLAYSLEKGVGSGIPGTTKFDEVASAVVNGYIKQYFSRVHKHVTADNLPDFLKTINKKVSEIYGLTFKPSSLNLYLFNANQDHYDFEFLGQTLQRVVGGDGVTTHYIPKPKLHRLLLTATTTRKSYKSVALQECAFQTMRRSLVANGGFLYPMFYESTKILYERKLDKGIRPLLETDEEFEYEVEEEKFYNPLPFSETDFSFPSVMTCMNLFLPHGNQLRTEGRSMNEHLGKTIVVPTIVPMMRLSLDSDDEETPDISSPFSTPGRVLSPKQGVGKGPRSGKLRGESEISKAFEGAATQVSGDWGAREALERDLFEDVGGVSVPAPKRVPVATQELKQPLPQEIKDAHNNAIKDKIAFNKAQKANSFDQSKKTKSRRQKKGGASTHNVIFDFDSVEYDGGSDQSEEVYYSD